MKDIDEAIQHCEDVAQQQDMLKGRYDDASGYTRSGNEAIRTSDAKKCEKCAADHRQLAEWLRELKQYKEKDEEVSLKNITQVRLIGHLDEDAIARLNTTGALVAAENKPWGMWMSTKDKLPDNKSYVLTTIKIPGRQPHVRSGWYQDGHFLNDNGDFWNDTDIEVVGWQYQPEPMRKE